MSTLALAQEMQDDLDMTVVHAVTTLGLTGQYLADPEPWPTYIDDEAGDPA